MLPAKSHQLKLSSVTSICKCNILFVSLCLQHNFRAWVWSQEPLQQESSLSSFALCWWLLQYFTGKTRTNMMRRTFQMRSGLMSYYLFYSLFWGGRLKKGKVEERKSCGTFTKGVKSSTTFHTKFISPVSGSCLRQVPWMFQISGPVNLVLISELYCLKSMLGGIQQP